MVTAQTSSQTAICTLGSTKTESLKVTGFTNGLTETRIRGPFRMASSMDMENGKRNQLKKEAEVIVMKEITLSIKRTGGDSSSGKAVTVTEVAT